LKSTRSDANGVVQMKLVIDAILFSPQPLTLRGSLPCKSDGAI
jgi:hypothetical protein